MAYIFEEEGRSERAITLAERIRKLERKLKLYERGEETVERQKQFKFPFKWRLKFNKSKRKNMGEMMLVFFMNKKNELEPPKFMPIFDGNMIVWENKPYEFDPRAVWKIKGIKGNPQAYFIKEIDRRPVMNRKGRVVYRDAAISNMDLDEIRARGDSTESDAFLIKAALKAQTSKISAGVSKMVLIILGIVAVGAIIWFLAS
jgi:hypothetical protein